MSKTELTPTAIIYTDSTANTATLGLADTSISFSKPLLVSKGVKSSFVVAGTVPDEEFRPAQALQDLSSLSLKNLVNEIVTLEAEENTSAITLTLPPTQGDSNTYLKNDGSGSLSWNAVGSAVGLHHAQNYGTRKAFFSSDRSTTTVIGDVKLSSPGSATFTGFGNRGGPGYGPITSLGNSTNLVLCERNYGRTQTVLSWSQGSSSVYWELFVSMGLAFPLQEDGLQKGWFIFGNDTIQNPVLNLDTIPGVSISTGIAVEYRMGLANHELRFYEGGVLRKTWTVFFKNETGHKTWRFTRNNRTIRIEMKSYAPDTYTYLQHTYVVEHDLTPGFEPTGDRWGTSHYNETNLTTNTNTYLGLLAFESYAV
jgi:hypothetical protein